MDKSMLREGASVVYKRTGTIGKVIELREMDGKIWAKLDSTGLFYDEDLLEMAEESVVEKPRQGIEEVEAELKVEEVEGKKAEKGRKEKSETPEIKDEGKIDTSGNVCGAG
ncbi:MAG: DUF2098 domain-containing protein [Candidatus Methanomethyliaceae archaeon]|nr:DUF2098 domain-containing protein [Candidatus Methanomethyliaceae archaeon]